jgi:CRISPR-associated protein Cas1
MTVSLPVLGEDEPLLGVGEIQSLSYCERLFYLRDVEQAQTSRNSEVVHEKPIEVRDTEVMELRSRALGLSGTVRVLWAPDGTPLPLQLKDGRCRRDNEDDTPLAWESDRLTAGASAMLVEEALGEGVTQARVRYEADRIAVPVIIDESLRDSVRRLVDRARDLRASINRPPVTKNRKLCHGCELLSVCSPQIAEPQIVPAGLHVLSDDTLVDCDASRLVIRPRGGREIKHAAEAVSAITLHGAAQITPSAIALCVERKIGVHWIAAGRHTASLTTSVGHVQSRIRQYAALADESLRLRLSRRVVGFNLHAQEKLLMQATRGAAAAYDRHAVHSQLQAVTHASSAAAEAPDSETLREIENRATTEYQAALLRLLGANGTEPQLAAVLEFGYTLLHTEVMRAVLASGLEPALGFYHAPGDAGYPLVLDLLGLFRAPLWDIAAIGSFHRRIWQPDDFSPTGLSEAARLKIVQLIQERLAETVKNPGLNRSMPWSSAIELEARLLEQEWSGEPGWFARVR